MQTNGSRKGTRWRVETSPFLIGRNDDCQLTLSSRTVSRRHCMIVFDSSSVLIKDLKSRNGTQVGGVTVSAETPAQLSHHTELQIGKYTFRLSIRDSKTNEPYRPGLLDLSTLSGAEVDATPETQDAQRLIAELDDLASRLEGGGNSSVIETTNLRHAAEDDTAKATSDAREDNDAAKVESSSESKQSTAEEQQRSETDLTESGDGPQKLPQHLRPKGPRDSQDAAAEALRNLFIR
ncbi:FHA domain-containing protein [Rhodopirellula sp. MGV]|uniref:FHA domain-containing protein n=1 Tax=Rhodopirellula sp. MGV TaxID=2023130 RepID=UPI001304410D|nr:FHA domain-containing protein [Rhodopirellula sp. MGV]